MLLRSREKGKATDKYSSLLVLLLSEEVTKQLKKRHSLRNRESDKSTDKTALELSLSVRGLIDGSFFLLVLLNSRKLSLPLS